MKRGIQILGGIALSREICPPPPPGTSLPPSRDRMMMKIVTGVWNTVGFCCVWHPVVFVIVSGAGKDGPAENSALNPIS
jgi:hypothetical protein